MTNRDMLNSLDNEILTYFIYSKLIPVIGKGVVEWLSQEADIDFWGDFEREVSKLPNTKKNVLIC